MLSKIKISIIIVLVVFIGSVGIKKFEPNDGNVLEFEENEFFEEDEFMDYEDEFMDYEDDYEKSVFYPDFGEGIPIAIEDDLEDFTDYDEAIPEDLIDYEEDFDIGMVSHKMSICFGDFFITQIYSKNYII